MTDIVGKLWGFCHTLRHDGIDYGDYIEQLTYLLSLRPTGPDLSRTGGQERTCFRETGPEYPKKYLTKGIN